MSPCAPLPSSKKAGAGEPSRGLGAPPEVSGELIKRRAIGPFTLSEHFHPAARSLASRANQEACITFVIEGTFREKYATGSLVCRPGGVRFLPAGVQHTHETDSELRCLEVRSAP